MSKIFGSMFLAFLLLSFNSSPAQEEIKGKVEEEAKKKAITSFTAGLGFTVIDGVLYYRIRGVPEIGFGKIGAGLDLDLLWNSKTGKLRTTDWNEKRDYAKIIKYIGFGGDDEVIKAQVGIIDDYTLGHGFIMNHYSNQTDENNRRLGLATKIDLNLAGAEGMTSNLGRFEIFALRGFVRPFQSLQIPIIKNFEAGISFVGDVDPDQNRSTGDGVSEFGFDAGFPIVRSEFFESNIYGDWAKIINHGSGAAIGISAEIKGAEKTFKLGAKLEERFLGKEFLPRYFDGLYEVERYRVIQRGPYYKTYQLARVDTTGKNGTFGELSGYVSEKVAVKGNYQYYRKVKHSGILHLVALAPALIPKTDLMASFDQKNVESTRDLFKANDNTLVTVEAGREIYPHLFLYLTYQRTFEYREEDQEGKPVTPGFYPIEKFSPRVDFKFKF